MPSKKQKKVTKQASDIKRNTELSWSAPEFVVYQRGPLWYLVAATLFAGAELLAVLVMRDPFTAVLLAISAIVILFHHRMEPRVLEYTIDNDTVRIGENEYHRNQLKSFWFSYEPVPQIHIEIKGRPLPITVLLNDVAEEDVRESMKELVAEDTSKQEDILTRVVRALKL